jgi:protein-tyrosine phosphatase
VIAHPERYVALQNHSALAAQWYEAGYVLQVNRPSLEGTLGYGAMDTAYELLSMGLAHVVASDAHDLYYRPTGLRCDRLEQCCSESYLHELLIENPRRIISDLTLK